MFLYVYDLKVFSRNPKEKEKCNDNIERFSKDIRMDFGSAKCTVVHTKYGVIFYSPYIRRITFLSGEIK